jgi:hypothetical protein
MPVQHDWMNSSASDGSVLAQAAALEESGHLVDALRVLSELNHGEPDARLEEHLVALRHRAFRTLDRSTPAASFAIDAAPTSDPLVPHTLASVTAQSLRRELAAHGCMWIRGLISRDRAGELTRGIDRAFEMFDAGIDGAGDDTSPWYVPFEPEEGTYRVGGRRKWVRASGAMWTADSPRMLREVCRVLSESGVGDLVTAHLGERPALSANKCTLRRVPIDTATNWHQDGAFLGTSVRTVNVWLALSDCSIDTPGLEIVPRRFDGVLPTGTPGAMFDWSVSPEVVADASHGTAAVEPQFRAGDALLFDHLLLHRTSVRPGMTRERYAIETWLFAPSSYPEGQIPLVY